MNMQSINPAQLNESVQQNAIRRMAIISKPGEAKYSYMRMAINVEFMEIASEYPNWQIYISQKVLCQVTRSIITNQVGILPKLFSMAQSEKVAIIFHDIDQAQPDFMDIMKTIFTAENGLYTLRDPNTELVLQAPEENIMIFAGVTTNNPETFVMPEKLQGIFDVRVWKLHD